jgi:hypothetical protein
MPRAPGAGTPSSVTVLTGQLTTAQPKRPAPETVSAGRHRVACSPPPPARPNRLANAHPGAHSPVSVASSIAAGSWPKKGTAAGLSRTINSVSRTVQDFFQLFPSSYVGNCEQTDSSPPAARWQSYMRVGTPALGNCRCRQRRLPQRARPEQPRSLSRADRLLPTLLLLLLLRRTRRAYLGAGGRTWTGVPASLRGRTRQAYLHPAAGGPGGRVPE